MAEYQKAKQYLDKYNVQDLFDFIQTEIVYQQPDNPRQFIANLIKQVRAGQFQFFSDEEIDILFKKFEILDRGYITENHCRNALRNIGINDEIVKLQQIEVEVTKDQFVQLVKKCLQIRVDKWNGK